MGGATEHGDHHGVVAVGLPPRGRGNRLLGGVDGHEEGSTPAWAGQPRVRPTTVWPVRVYPRVGGATALAFVENFDAKGLPPRGRGNRTTAAGTGSSIGSTPAWAGQPTSVASRSPPSSVYPRVGGATCHGGCCPLPVCGLPPRGRGNPRRYPPGKPCEWSTPAWAGQPSAPSLPISGPRVYPRVGGATWTNTTPPLAARGLPPRGRGNPTQVLVRVCG